MEIIFQHHYQPKQNQEENGSVKAILDKIKSDIKRLIRLWQKIELSTRQENTF